ncbi:MAG TPA: trimeric intracellular cation channel family protein [Trueperaceae bacterium]
MEAGLDALTDVLLSQSVLIPNLVGTFVFALSGGVAGVKGKVDMFGLAVLAFAAGNAGGITRDLLLGRFPAGSISDWRYLAVSVLAAIVVFFWYPDIDRRRRLVLYFDAGGLALFAVTGTLAALSVGLSPILAPVMGMVTGIGGGIVRDVLVNETPAVLRSELYAIAALAGGLVVVAGDYLGWSWLVTFVIGAGLCFFLRMMGIHKGWHLPTAQWSSGSSD